MKSSSCIIVRMIMLLLVALQAEKTFATPPFFNIAIFKKDTAIVKDSFWVSCANISSLPKVFQKGYVMIYRRELPGAIDLVDVKGNIVWSYQSKNAGFRVVRFTKNHTLLCITGTKENDSGYGNTILELSLRGDTLLFLTQGQNQFQQAVHHEILLNSRNEIVTLFREGRVFDLSGKGGLQTDTV